jgi:hypothetical protein
MMEDDLALPFATLVLGVEDKEFRALLSNLGLAIHTIRVRRSGILAVMDEFLATARDLQAPLEELAEFSGERATGAREGSKAGKDRDNHRYQKLIRYQPRSGKPEKTSRAYAALVGQSQEYDRLSSNPAFAHLDSRTDDNQVLLCLGPCGGSSVPKRPGSGVPPVVTSIAADAGADGRDAGSLVARNPTPLVMPPHRDRALVVATDRYANPAWPRLAFPVRDARRIARALKGLGFEVTLLENATVAQFERAFQRLATESWGEYDQFLVYIAGHGDFREAWHSGRLVLADSTDDVGNYKSWPELRDALTGHRSRHVLLVLDVCYGGTFEPAVAFEGAERLAYRGAPHEIDERQAAARLGRRTRRFLSSVGKDLTPDRSAFAAALAAFLEDAQNRYRTDLDLAATVQHVSPSPVASSFQGDEAAGAFVFHPARGDVERR